MNTNRINRTALVTGATAGIGFETARLLAASGFRVIVHGRTRAEAAAVDRLVLDGVPSTRLSPAHADFVRLTDVVELARQVSDTYPELGLLVNNAAVLPGQSRVETPDGNELAFQVNYLAPYLVTRLLTPNLTDGRVVNVSSSLHRGGSLSWTDLNRKHRYTPLAAYAQSKLALTVFTRSIAEFGDSEFTAVSVHPGIAVGGLLPMYGTRGGSTESAAAVVARLGAAATDPVHGAYYEGFVLGTPALSVEDRRTMARLLKETGLIAGRMRAAARVATV